MDGDLRFACVACGQHIACGPEHAGLTFECPTCRAAVVVPAAAPAATATPSVAVARPGVLRPDRETWKSLGLGLGIATVVSFVPFLTWMFRFLGTVIHELGHWLVMLYFGYPSVPAFHVLEGGFTMTLVRMPLLLLAAYGAWAWLLWNNRHSRRATLVIGSLVVVYAMMAHAGVDKLVAYAAGHATQLLVAGVFLYRSWAGSAILVPAERPLYAALGFHMVGVQLSFATKILTDPTARQAYIYRENAVNDFVRLRDEAGLPLDLSMLLILLAALAVPILSFLAFRYQPAWRRRLKEVVRTQE